MRTGYNGNFIRNEHGRLLGVNLGSDFCAEHEWGIKDISVSFGIPSLNVRDTSLIGIERRKITRCPSSSELILENTEYQGKNIWCLLYAPEYCIEQNRFNETINLRSFDSKEIFHSAWDEKSFRLITDNEKAIIQIYEAIKKLDVCIGTMGASLFANPGLTICIASAVPYDVQKMWESYDKDQANLYTASDATGIIQKIDDINRTASHFHDKKCGYYSLRPAWAEKKSKSKHLVQYWLNPTNQKHNKAGWYSVEQLEEWIEGKGPVIIPKDAVKWQQP